LLPERFAEQIDGGDAYAALPVGMVLKWKTSV